MQIDNCMITRVLGRNIDAWTRLEVIAIIALLVTACSFLALWLAKAKFVTVKLTCANRLDRIGIAFTDYDSSHNGLYPMKVSPVQGGTAEFTSSGMLTYKHFQILLGNGITPSFYVCPQDRRKASASLQSLANSNISYFVGLGAQSEIPDSILAGDRNVSRDGSLILQVTSGLKWVKSVGLHGDIGHVLLADGHVQEVDSAVLGSLGGMAVNLTNRLSIP